MNLKDIFQHDYDQSSCHISKCGNSRCKTCPILDTSGSFTSSLTNKSYCTQGFEDFNCKTSNLIYGIVCSLCGLIYSISSPIRHTCSVHVLSKILTRIYHIVIQTHISPQSKITGVHQNKKVINNMFLNKINSLKVCLIGDEIGYVGETKGQLNKRISGHRFQINDNGGQLLYRHFNQPDHSIVSMKVVIIEKIYHHTNSPTLSTHFRRQREEFWIKTLGTASP